MSELPLPFKDASLLFRNVKQLPALPSLLLELMDSFNDNVRVKDIAQKIGMDQAVSAKVIHIANSAAFRRRVDVNSISQAVIRLGFNQVRSIVIAVSLSNVFPKSSTFDTHTFWLNTFTTASIAKALAKNTTNVNEETAFTCAMMHNIGELLLQSLKPEEYSLVTLAINSGEPRLSAQRDIFGFDHTQVGAGLAKHWNFSAVFCDAIEQQLDPLSFKQPSKETILIRLSVFASFAWKANLSPDMIIARFPTSLTEHLHLKKDGLAAEFEDMIEAGQELASLISA